MRKSSAKHLERRHLRRHLFGPSRGRLLLVSVAVLSALVLTLLARSCGWDGQREPAEGRPAATASPTTVAAVSTSLPSTTTTTTTVSALPQPVAGGLLADAGFVAGLGPWRPFGGARLERVASGRKDAWAASLTAGTAGADAPGIAVPNVALCRAGSVYAGELWVRGNRPGMPVEVRLLEVVNGVRFAIDTVGAVLVDTRWRRVELAHAGHRDGATLSIELIAPQLRGADRLLIDDVRIDPREHT
jgi:hypothetical protein